MLKVELTYDSSIQLLDIYLKILRVESQRGICTTVHCSFIHNSPEGEAKQMYINGWID